MPDFDPARPCRSFRPDHAGRGRRRANALHFVEQDGGSPPAGATRFVVKSYRVPGEPVEESRARLQRERDGEAAFVALGESVLAPCAGPFETLELDLDGRREPVDQALVFPWLPAPTLFDVLRTAPASRGRAARAAGGHGAPGAGSTENEGVLLARVVARLAARHARARRVADLHSDGAAHNILVVPRTEQAAAPAAAVSRALPGASSDEALPAPAGDLPALLWFDFAEPHAAADVAEARAVELLAFLLSVVEASRTGDERARVAAVSRAYVAAWSPPAEGLRVLRRVLALRSPRRPGLYALRQHLRLRSWAALRSGDTTQLARFRLWRALRAELR